MQIKPVASPTAIPVTFSDGKAAKTRAMAAFNAAGQPPQQVVQNQNNVSPEEMTAIVSPPSERQDDTDIQVAPQEEIQELATATPPPPSEPEKVEDPALSRQFAQLARQTKALRAKQLQQEQAIKAREDALNAREAALSTKDQQYQTGYISRDTLKQDPLSVLAEAGVSYDELTQQIINQQPKDPRVEATMRQLEAKIKALEAKNEESQKSYTEQQKQQYQAAVKQIETDARTLVSNDPNFETIKATNSVKDVVALITQTYDKDGVLLTVEEAAQQVEDYLVEEYMKMTKIEKIKKRLQTVAPPAPPQVKTPATPKQTPPMKTLTNATSSTRKLTAKERAILAFKGELQKS